VALRANLEGTVTTVRSALPSLSSSSAGRAVLISSGVSRHGMTGATAYATAKARLDGLMAAVKWEAGEHGVLINIVSPGFTVTETNLARFSDDVRESVRQRTRSGRVSLPRTSPAPCSCSAHPPTATSPAPTFPWQAASTN
jgi:NAD(P)-dependent dehydrogenase (short-subunit alcohol dehydrogenase family)